METTHTEDDYDVVIVGYGPVGRLLALKLGRRGHRVLVLEKQPAMYFLPRAVHLDDEACRILQSIGSGPDRSPDAIGPYNDYYEWRNADRQTLLRLDWRGRGPSGWNVSNFFNQPLLERNLHGLVENEPTIEVVFGAAVTGFRQDGDSAHLTYRDEGGVEHEVAARYVVGADGAKSLVRTWIGGDITDLGYFHDWLVVDLVMKADAIPFDPPAWQLCDPQRPTTLVPGGPGRRRFEFMRLPDETAEELNVESTAWRLLEPWGIGPDEAVLERHTVYTFQARWADRWRSNRALIAGDAAHLMPPFAGQGMCSGLRDAANLEWKLDLVLRGLAPDALLDTYGSERKDHVRDFIEASMALGEVICITDPAQAEDRDIAMRSDFLAGVEQPPRPLPQLGAGFFNNSPAAGTLSIQPVVQASTGVGLFDDVTNGGATLLVDDDHRLDELSADDIEALLTHQVQIVTLSDAPGVGRVVDVDSEMGRWLASHGAAAALIRPDFYVFGTAGTTEVPALVRDFLSRLKAPVRV